MKNWKDLVGMENKILGISTNEINFPSEPYIQTLVSTN